MATSTKTKRAAKKRATRKALRILVLRAPGTNCDRETAYAFETAGATTKAIHVNALLDKPKQIERAHGLVIPGGFSYGDVLGAGGGWAKSILFHDRLRDDFSAFFADSHTTPQAAWQSIEALPQT